MKQFLLITLADAFLLAPVFLFREKDSEVLEFGLELCVCLGLTAIGTFIYYNFIKKEKEN